MERVSGWYKRRVQLILAGIAVSVVLLLNADTLAAGASCGATTRSGRAS